uniref:Uncharacterized protein n=1 Tax=Anguilla anguilla TaxID=7936 RepID=A0A0E9XVS0_ANGAN
MHMLVVFIICNSKLSFYVCFIDGSEDQDEEFRFGSGVLAIPVQIVCSSSVSA